jgi:Fic family protein
MKIESNLNPLLLRNLLKLRKLRKLIEPFNNDLALLKIGGYPLITYYPYYKDNFSMPFKPTPSGRYVTNTISGETVQAYVPYPLPPQGLDLTPLHGLLETASRLLGELNGMAAHLPNLDLFLYHYIRQEALLSSQIEGTQSSYHDLMLHEARETPNVPLEDVEEVSTYVAAIHHGLRRLKENDFPLSLRLLREVHDVLLSNTRGQHKQPGAFRRSQNWIGGTRPSNAFFVPPPPEMLDDCLKDLETFIHEDESKLPHLIKVALLHVQFETIHPFLDGNGRLGRLLITLYLIEKDVLHAPVLYLSLYLKTHRETYYRLLNEIRFQGGWSAWLEFFLTGVIETCQAGLKNTQAIVERVNQDKAMLSHQGRQSETLESVLEFLLKHPVCSIPYASKGSGISQPTMTKALQTLQALGIVKEESGKQRGKLYAYTAYIDLLSADKL